MWTSPLANLDDSTAVMQWVVVVAVTLAASATDIRSRRIPNWLTAPVFVAGLLWAVWVAGVGGIIDGLAGALVMMGPFVLLFLFAGGGAGDAKLMAAIGAWLGVTSGMIALASVVIAGGVLGVLWAIASRQGRNVSANLASMSVGLFALVSGQARLAHARQMMPENKQMQKMPYGPAICLGVILAAIVTFV